MAAYGSPTISLETIWSSVALKIPCQRGWSAASRNILLISSAVVDFAETNVIAESEPVTTGTRIEVPSNFPSTDLTALPTATAAPVYEGTMFTPAALPRLKSCPLTGPSTKFWVAVYPCVVFKNAFLTPIVSERICKSGEAELVVQEPFEDIEQVLRSSSLTPISTVFASSVSSSFAGAVITTLLAPACL